MRETQHIVKSYDEELQSISTRIIEMGGLVEAQLADAIEAVVKRNAQLGAQTDQRDAQVDAMEREIDEAVVRLLARRQPMADDLRQVLAALKIVGILERVGDYAAHVGKRAVMLAQDRETPGVAVIGRMGKMVRDLIGDVLGAYARRDPELALSVWRRDQDLDQLYASFFRELLTAMAEDPKNINACMHLLFIAKNIERVGDFATNIAENVHFLVLGVLPAGKRPKAAKGDYSFEQ
ncbi:phosphate signaling complex protein PhoU [Shumkonia mesophila]|uniref:phosphate signaling complex protein PhoU n=1 Tax=Shumkonia mesophila TaxID=2838854 RepID=UPI00293498FE|nr:phosphate signaling complex protein PhoU [Shumkonia mesophila]